MNLTKDWKNALIFAAAIFIIFMLDAAGPMRTITQYGVLPVLVIGGTAWYFISWHRTSEPEKRTAGAILLHLWPALLLFLLTPYRWGVLICILYLAVPIGVSMFFNNRGRRRLGLLLSVLSVVLLTVAVYGVWTTARMRITDRQWIQKRTGIDVGNLVNLCSEDTHGGPHGEGYALYVLQCPEEAFARIDAPWKEFPFIKDEDIRQWMPRGLDAKYGDGSDSAEAGKEFPEIRTGFWVAVNRSSGVKDRFNAEELFSGAALKYSLLVYDAGNELLYYYEEDI